MITADEIQNNVLTAHLLMHGDIDCRKAFIIQLSLVNCYARLKREEIYSLVVGSEATFVSEM